MSWLADFFLGKKIYCWEVLRDNRRIGYLCKDYKEFKTLLEGLEHPLSCELRVRQIKARYRPPKDPFVYPKSSNHEKQKPKRLSELTASGTVGGGFSSQSKKPVIRKFKIRKTRHPKIRSHSRKRW